MEQEEIKKADGKSWIDFMRKYKPDITDKEADYILWNETCYPFSYESTLKQIHSYFTLPKGAGEGGITK